MLLLLPDDPSTTFMLGLVFFIMGLCISWNAPTTNKYVSSDLFRMYTVSYNSVIWCLHGLYSPIFAEIVPRKSRTSIYALDRSFESLLASLAPPVAGFCCSVFMVINQF